jgi:hypothetical protein
LLACKKKKKWKQSGQQRFFFFFLKVPRNRVAEKSREQKKARKEKQEGEGDDLKGGYIKKRSDNWKGDPRAHADTQREKKVQAATFTLGDRWSASAGLAWSQQRRLELFESLWYNVPNDFGCDALLAIYKNESHERTKRREKVRERVQQNTNAQIGHK